jgi:DNA mismatch repair ATPase MutS
LAQFCGTSAREAGMSQMVKTLENAVAEASTLPEADQEEIGRQLLSHIEKLRLLRQEIDKGIRSLEAGEGKLLDIDEFLAEQNARHGRS